MRVHLTLALCLTVLTGCGSRDEGPRTDPEVFAQHDFGALNFQALNTVAVPWKLVAAALVLDDPQGGEVSQTHLKARLQMFDLPPQSGRG